HAHDLGAMRVDDLLVQQVTGEAKRLGRKLRIGGRLKAVAKTEMTDLLREIAPAHDLLPGRRREDGPLRGRELPLRHDRDVRELARLDEAKAAFAEVLKIEPYNSIALRGNSRVATLQEHKTKAFTTTTRTQPRLFIEDMGKTGILRLINPAPTHVLAKYSPGAECELREQEGLLALHARDGELIGFLEPKVGRRLIDLIRTGNQYDAAIVSNDPANARVAIRELFSSPENASRISFPG